MTSNKVHVWSVEAYEDRHKVRLCIGNLFAENRVALQPVRRAGSGAFVVVKPNWVQESHEYRRDVWEPVITHPSVVLSTVDVLAEIMQGSGTICVCDAPHTYADFERIVAHGRFLEELEAIRGKWPDLRIEVLDLRREIWERKEEVVVRRRENAPDPRGYVRLNLGRDSHFYRHSGEGRYYGADYATSVVNAHHQGDLHEYLLSGSALHCDLFINVAKLKTHKKTGITCCLKNLVGINGDKNWLPHHTEGSPASRGDEFPIGTFASTIESSFKRAGRQIALNMPFVGTWLYRKMRNAGKTVLGDSQTTIRNGDWRGNDTCWRMALDLNRALLYGDADGTWRNETTPKAYLAIVDGVIGGEGNGPLCPDPVDSRVLIGGSNPACVDAVASRLIGFDPKALPIVAHAFDPHRWPIAAVGMEEIVVRDERVGDEIPLSKMRSAVDGGFRPHFGWANVGRVA